MSHAKYFKRGTTTCPKDGEPLHWEQIHGMRLVRQVGSVEVYQARCPKCLKHWSVQK